VPGPRARAGAQPARGLKRAVRHRHQLRLRRGGRGAIFDGKKGKRSEDTPAEGSKSKEPHHNDKRGKKGKKPRREAREQGATAVMPRPLLLTRLDGALDRPLEVRGCLMTC
jgi:hypothetical protein